MKTIVLELIDEATKDVSELTIKTKHKTFNKAENELFTLHTTLANLKDQAKSVKDEKLIDETFNIFQELYDKLTQAFNFTQMSIQEAKERKGII